MVKINTNVTFSSGLLYHLIQEYGPSRLPYTLCGFAWSVLVALLVIAFLITVISGVGASLLSMAVWVVWMILNSQTVEANGWAWAGALMTASTAAAMVIIIIAVLYDDWAVGYQERQRHRPIGPIKAAVLAFKDKYCPTVTYTHEQ